MNLLNAFLEFNNGTRKSVKLKNEEKDEKQTKSDEKNKSQTDKAKAIKDSLKEKCEGCNGTGLLEETKDSQGRCFTCTQCLGRGYIKKRKKPNLKVKKKREAKLLSNKLKKRIVKMYLDEDLTFEEISDKIKMEQYLVETVIKDMMERLEAKMNKNNKEE